MSCYWCGSETERVACLGCLTEPERTAEPSYVPEFDDPAPPPSPERLVKLDRLRAFLLAGGIDLIHFTPDEPEWIALNAERFFFELETALSPA